ncbi:hypothetical protein BT93_E1119 [Corymbia citriodora subsp. variegata]|nr:hypothetical protein BT93_E1119 [Corymbia citriodora subsp. variegata]
MNMSLPLTPSKRPGDQGLEPNGKAKRQNSVGKVQNQPSSGSLVYRVLCPAAKCANFLENGGIFISQIHDETGLEVRVEESIPGCDERVVVILGSGEVESASKMDQENRSEEATADKEVADAKEQSESKEDKEPVEIEDLKHEKEVSSAQRALLLVFDRLVEGEAEPDVGDEDDKKSSSYVLRLLVLSSQAGRVLGKGGSVIKQMSNESGADIQILPWDKLPHSTSSSDEIVQITGEIEAVRKALLLVSQQLSENVPRDNEASPANTTGQSSNSSCHALNRSAAVQGAAKSSSSTRDGRGYRSTVRPMMPKFNEGGLVGQMRPPKEVLCFRLLCSSERVGGIIGKGGNVVRALEQDTGCEIKVVEGLSDAEDRIVAISGPAYPEDRVSAVQDAVLRVQNRIVRSTPDNEDSSGCTARMLVSSNQIGCLLGKGGSVIAEMRKSSGAYIRILGKDQIPTCASENEEVVQSHMEGGGPLDFPDFAGPPRRIPGFGGSFDLSRGGQPAIITNTTVEVVVPRSLVPIIYGEEGGCLKQIRQISDARITITEPKPGATDTVIIISGTPEQTHAAQSLIQAFVMIESELA